MQEEYHKLQPKPKTTDESKATLMQTIWEELPQEHINKAVANFAQRLTVYMAVTIPMMVTSSICSNSVSSSLHPHLFISSATNRLF